MDVAREIHDIKPLHSGVKRIRLSGSHVVSPGIIPASIPSTRKHRPPSLPNELWDKIFSLLDVYDVKAVRASWKLWSGIGARHLFPIFRFSLGRKDFRRFEKVARDGQFLIGIKELYLESGKTGIFWISEALAVLYREPQLHQSDPERQYQVEFTMTRTLAEYARWNVVAHKNNNNFRNVRLLTDVLQYLKTLDSIHITRRSPRIKSPVLLHAWNFCRQADYFERAVSEFEALLLALNSSGTKIRNLSHDQLPVTFFKIGFQRMQQLTVPLEGLKSLHLTFDATVPPQKVFWVGLGPFLQSLAQLSDLRFGFFPIRDKYRNGASWENCDDMISWYIPLWKLLGTFTWTQLKTLRLDGMLLCEAGLMEVLERHATTLDSLDLASIGLWQGSFKHLFVRLKLSLKLKHFKLWGYFKAFQCSNEEWRLQPRVFPCEKAWHEITNEFNLMLFQQTFVDDGLIYEEDPQYLLSEKVEAFVLWKGNWPMEISPSADFEDGSALDRAAIDESWDERPDGKDDIMWEFGWSDDVYPNGDEILELYDSDGYDAHGFNIDGYNGEGIFHSDSALAGENTRGRMSHATTKRRILRRIKDKIPRLDGVRIGT